MGAGEDSHYAVSRRVFNAACQEVSAGKQRPVPGTGIGTSAFLPFRLLPFTETVVGESAFAEVLFDVALGNVSGQNGHLASAEFLYLFSILGDFTVKFLYIHCLLNK